MPALFSESLRSRHVTETPIKPVLLMGLEGPVGSINGGALTQETVFCVVSGTVASSSPNVICVWDLSTSSGKVADCKQGKALVKKGKENTAIVISCRPH